MRTSAYIGPFHHVFMRTEKGCTPGCTTRRHTVAITDEPVWHIESFNIHTCRKENVRRHFMVKLSIPETTCTCIQPPAAVPPAAVVALGVALLRAAGIVAGYCSVGLGLDRVDCRACRQRDCQFVPPSRGRSLRTGIVLCSVKHDTP